MTCDKTLSFRQDYEELNSRQKKELLEAMRQAFGWKTLTPCYRRINGCISRMTYKDKPLLDGILKRFNIHYDGDTDE